MIENSKGFISTATISLLLLVAVFITSLAFIFGYRVAPGMMGVKQILVGPDQGYNPVALEPGFYGSIPYRSKIHILPAIVQIVDVNKSINSSGLEITTSDGNYVSVLARVVFSFYKNPGEETTNDGRKITFGGPADLIGRLGLSADSWRNQVNSISSDKLIRSLSELSASQFYDPSLRWDKVLKAQSQIKESLAPFGIKLERVLIDRYTYVDNRIDEAIFRKNIQSQEEKLNEQKSKLSEASAKLEQVSAEWDAKIESLRVEGSTKSAVIKSEADLYEKSKQAEGDLLYAKAQAEVDRLKANVLQSVDSNSAASTYVARQIAPLVSSLKGGIVQNQDPYDLDSWIDKLGATK
jgi:regulator of protease activity HflC (stomatin/prohibitin superfamily)